MIDPAAVPEPFAIGAIAGLALYTRLRVRNLERELADVRRTLAAKLP